MTYSLSLKLETSSASLAIVTAYNSKTIDNLYCFGITACIGFYHHSGIHFMTLHVVQSLVKGEHKMLNKHFTRSFAQVYTIK